MPGGIILPDMPACSVSVKNNVKTFPAIAKNNYHIKSANVICCPQPFSSKVLHQRLQLLLHTVLPALPQV